MYVVNADIASDQAAAAHTYLIMESKRLTLAAIHVECAGRLLMGRLNINRGFP